MPVTDVTTDLDNRTLTLIAEFAAPVERVWGIYADPRQLEQVWGPEGYPATFVDHALEPGGKVTYYMTSPEGDKYAGYWAVDTVDAPRRFTFRDGFALDAETFAPNTDMPESSVDYSFESIEGGTRAVYVTSYATAEALQQVLDMGMVEGSKSAIGQIDAFLAA